MQCTLTGVLSLLIGLRRGCSQKVARAAHSWFGSQVRCDATAKSSRGHSSVATKRSARTEPPRTVPRRSADDQPRRGRVTAVQDNLAAPVRPAGRPLGSVRKTLHHSRLMLKKLAKGVRALLDNHAAAVITGVTAIIAAGLVAWFTTQSTTDVIREESRRVAEVRNEDARGAARVLIGEFVVVGEELADWVTNGFLERFGPDFPVEIRQQDLALIAARVTPRQWNEISRGLSSIQQLQRYVLDRTRGRTRFTGKLISRRIVQIVADDLDAVRAASLALSRVAGVRDEVPGTTISDVDAVFGGIQRKSRRYGIPIAEP